MSTPFLSDYLKLVEATADVPADPTTDPGTSPEMIAFCFDAETQTLSFWDPVNEDRLIVALGVISRAAEDITYDNAASGLAATDVQAAIDELDATVDGLSVGSYTDEEARDAIALFIQNGTGITWSHNDGADTLTPTVSLASFNTGNLSEGSNLYYTDERAQDAVAGMLVDSNTVNFTYTDATPAVAAVVTPKSALVYVAANFSGSTTGANVPWDTAAHNDTWQPSDAGGTQRAWLGANFTFVDADVSAGNDTITETSHGFVTGEGPVFVSNSGGALPAGLAAATKYWIIVDDANTFRFATSRANALSGVDVDITAAAGGGTHTCRRGEYFVIPAGVTKCRVDAFEAENSGTLSGVMQIIIAKNDAATSVGFSCTRQQPAAATQTAEANTPMVVVTEGDMISLQEVHADTITITGGTGANNAHFGIQFW